MTRTPLSASSRQTSMMPSSKNCASHDIDVGGHQQDVPGRVDRRGADGVGVVRDDLLFRIAHVDAGFEDFNLLVGEFGAFETAYQLFGLA